jgi:hypothetical protein
MPYPTEKCRMHHYTLVNKDQNYAPAGILLALSIFNLCRSGNHPFISGFKPRCLMPCTYGPFYFSEA